VCLYVNQAAAAALLILYGNPKILSDIPPYIFHGPTPDTGHFSGHSSPRIISSRTNSLDNSPDIS